MTKQKTTPAYSIKVSPELGYYLAPLSVGAGRKRRLQAYECMNLDCEWNFRVETNTPAAAKHGAQITCPRCGSLYVEWLSYGMKPEDVFLSTDEEWDQIPNGRVVMKRLQDQPTG